MSDSMYNLWSGRHQKWWKANGLGYTDDRAEAGRFDEEQTVASLLRSAGGGDPKLVTCAVIAPEYLEPVSATVTVTHQPRHSAVEEAMADATAEQRAVVDDATAEYEIVWQCTKCSRVLAGNPRWCTGCGYTVYRPLGPSTAGTPL